MIDKGSAVLARTPHPSPEAVSTALADAFLAAEQWNAEALARAGNHTCGSPRRWITTLAAHIVASYPRPPVDAPRELAAVVRQSKPFTRALARASRTGKPLPLKHYTLDPAVARHSPLDVPDIGNLSELARLLGITPGELEWFADPKHLNRNAAPILAHYRYVWHTRPGRVPRLLEVPAPRLRALQRVVLSQLLCPIPPHPAAHGFVPGRSAVTGAGAHTGKLVVVNLDLATFFAKVTAGRVFGVMRQAGYAEAVAHRLTGLCTHRVPARVLSQMPPGGDPADRFALRQALALPHLPQGAPTSPMLANLAVRRMDSRLAGWARRFDAGYTRYADDLAFSGGRDLARGADAFIAGVGRIVADEGHRLNHRKTRVRGASARQSVTGVVVNAHPNVRRTDIDRLKAILHNCATYGPSSQNLEGHAEFQAQLLGRIAWVAGVNPHRGAQLRAVYRRISW
ncbi:reverse transcriptase family protein [Arthrobacter alpinus]|uniref:reverse transcriptase family protein n=1 Tax=Arthrobacter alpinus TaxID=656366 RepID=UPI0009E6844A|nr:reverse transcriptase family protein [Arthrobacter alpinus]